MNCKCKTCDCKSVCAFYEAAVEPVIKVVEGEDYDLSDIETVAYLKALTGVLEDFSCDKYE